jgi:hypothetical protein
LPPLNRRIFDAHNIGVLDVYDNGGKRAKQPRYGTPSTALDLDGAQRTGGNAGAATHAHADGKEHGRILRIFLFEQFMAAGAGRLAHAVIRIASGGVALFEIDICVFVHRCL